MNFRCYGDTASVTETALEKRDRRRAENLARLKAVMAITQARTDAIQESKPGDTVEDVLAAAELKLKKSSTKPAYLMYAALGIGAYLMLK